jgi:uncharacterized hydrophobic protein (TIGR00341 family)
VPLRLIEAVLPGDVDAEVDSLFEEHPVIDCWRDDLEGDLVRVGLLVDAGAAEPVMDDLEARFGDRDGFRVVLLPVQASLPRPEDDDAEGQGAGPDAEDDEEAPDRIGREELYAELSDAGELTPFFMVMSVLSAVVCAFGLLMDDIAVVIGAMVIAPLLGPLVALSLATTLADADLAREGLIAGAAGLGVTFLLALGMGWAVPVDAATPAVANRSTVEMGHVGLALAAGAAGTLAYTTGTAAAVIGVMVAVALVPPLVAGGLLLGDGHVTRAGGALLLTLVNLICVNLAGVVSFLAQGVRPNRWWEAERAKKATAAAVVIWSVMLAALVAVIMLWAGPAPG